MTNIGTTTFLLLIFTLLLSIISKKTGFLVEHPNDRKNHKKPVPLIGGTILFLTVLTASKVGVYNTAILLDPIFYLIFIIGLVDDLYEIPYYTKLILQIVAGTLFVLTNHTYLFFGNQLIDKLFSIFFFVVILNAFNLVDGINGLLLGISIIYSVANSDFTLSFILFLLLILNLKEYLFMGDSGAFLVAYLIFKRQNISYNFIQFLVYYGYPLYEITSSFMRRLLFGKNPFKADRYHLHHIGVEKFGLTSFLAYAYLLTGGFSFLSTKKLGFVIYLFVCVILFIFQIVNIRRLENFQGMFKRDDSNFKL